MATIDLSTISPAARSHAQVETTDMVKPALLPSAGRLSALLFDQPRQWRNTDDTAASMAEMGLWMERAAEAFADLWQEARRELNERGAHSVTALPYDRAALVEHLLDDTTWLAQHDAATFYPCAAE